jgi:hypothetical protein
VLGALTPTPPTDSPGPHAEDDFPTIQEVMLATRGGLGERKAPREPAATTCWRCRIRRDVRSATPRDLAPSTRALVEAYAAGLNRYAHPFTRGSCAHCPDHWRRLVAGCAPDLALLLRARRGRWRAKRERAAAPGSLSVERGSNAFPLRRLARRRPRHACC